MTSKPTFIVTAYGSWAKTATNPSTQILTRLRSLDWPGFTFVGLEVPVVSATLVDLVEKNLLAHKPDFWMSIGVASGAALIRAEMLGTNWLDFGVPDNEGACPKGVPVVERGPVAYNADFPNPEIVKELKAMGIPAMLSYSAGTHMCNQMLYTTSHLIARHQLKTRCGFLHVPITPEQVAQQSVTETAKASMDLNTMTRAAEHVLRHMMIDAQTRAGKL